jgi:hypothetical protein
MTQIVAQTADNQPQGGPKAVPKDRKTAKTRWLKQTFPADRCAGVAAMIVTGML